MLSYIRRFRAEPLTPLGISITEMLPLLHASLVFWIGVGWLVAMCLCLVVVVPLCIVAKGSSVAQELDAALDRLEEVRAPSGQRFFATPIAREELSDELRELVR